MASLPPLRERREVSTELASQVTLERSIQGNCSCREVEQAVPGAEHVVPYDLGQRSLGHLSFDSLHPFELHPFPAEVVPFRRARETDLLSDTRPASG